MRARVLGCLLAVAIAGCGDGAEQGAVPKTSTAATTTTTATTAKAAKAKTTTRAPERPPPLASGAPEQAVAGRKLVIAAGCLACHQIGSAGASKPGNNLEGGGSSDEIRQALVQPPAGMPAYDVLADSKLDAIAAYLSSLREGGCSEGSDCG